MVDEIVTRQELIDAKRDARDLGKAVNENTIVDPRYGEDFKSLPMIAAEAQATIGEWESAIATITQEGGVPALAVSTANGDTQQEINDYIGADWRNKAGGYGVGDRVRLLNGDTVISLIDGNTNNPNSNLSGWLDVFSSGVSSISELKGLRGFSLKQGRTITLTQEGRQGLFYWAASDQSVNVALDTYNGIYVAPSTDSSGASGAWIRVKQSNAMQLSWFGAVDGSNTSVSPIVASALNVLATTKYTRLECYGNFVFDAQMGEVPLNKKIKYGKFTALGNTTKALHLKNFAKLDGVEIDASGFAMTSAYLVTAEPNGKLKTCKLHGLHNLGTATGTTASYLLKIDVASGTFEVDGCHLYDVTNVGDGLSTNAGFVGHVFAYGTVPAGNRQEIIVKNSRLEDCKTITPSGATQEVQRLDNDADSIRGYTDSTDETHYKRFIIKSTNNTFNRCAKRFYKGTKCTFVINGDTSDEYYNDIEMYCIIQATRYKIQNCDFNVNAYGPLFECPEAFSGIRSTLRSSSIINNHIPVASINLTIGQAALAKSPKGSELDIQNIYIQGIRYLYTSGTANGCKLNIDGVTGSTLGGVLSYDFSYGDGATLKNINLDLNIPLPMEYNMPGAFNLVGRDGVTPSKFFMSDSEFRDNVARASSVLNGFSFKFIQSGYANCNLTNINYIATTVHVDNVVTFNVSRGLKIKFCSFDAAISATNGGSLVTIVNTAHYGITTTNSTKFLKGNVDLGGVSD